MLIAEDDPLEIVGELLRIDASTKVSFRDGAAHGVGNEIEPVALELHEPRARRTVLIVELRRRLEKDAAALRVRGPLPVHPSIEQRAHAQLAAAHRQRRLDDEVDEASGSRLEHLDLEGLLGSEVREQTALGEMEFAGEPANGEIAQPDLASEGHRVIENRQPGRLALAHAVSLIRTFVLFKASAGNRPDWCDHSRVLHSTGNSTPGHNTRLSRMHGKSFNNTLPFEGNVQAQRRSLPESRG